MILQRKKKKKKEKKQINEMILSLLGLEVSLNKSEYKYEFYVTPSLEKY